MLQEHPVKFHVSKPERSALVILFIHFVEVCAASSLGHFVNFLLRDAFLMLM